MPPQSRKIGAGLAALIAGGLAGALAIAVWIYWPPIGEPKKQYWATSLSRAVDDGLLRGLYEAVRRGEVGWLDVDPKHPIPPLEPGINLILYHVGGNCYIGSDCDRFPSSEPTGDQWGGTERAIYLNDPTARKIVIEDLLAMVQQGDKLAPGGSIVGVHLDNVHGLSARALADMFNEFRKAVEGARDKGLIAKTRKVGYVAKNNAEAFKKALEQGWLHAPPLYQINENARLSEAGRLNSASRTAQQIGREFCIPVFLKTFGSDVAYAIEQSGVRNKVYVSQEMTRQMAQLPNISGVAWSANETNYHPTLFVQGSPVRQVPFGGRCSE